MSPPPVPGGLVQLLLSRLAKGRLSSDGVVLALEVWTEGAPTRRAGETPIIRYARHLGAIQSAIGVRSKATAQKAIAEAVSDEILTMTARVNNRSVTELFSGPKMAPFVDCSFFDPFVESASRAPARLVVVNDLPIVTDPDDVSLTTTTYSREETDRILTVLAQMRMTQPRAVPRQFGAARVAGALAALHETCLLGTVENPAGWVKRKLERKDEVEVPEDLDFLAELGDPSAVAAAQRKAKYRLPSVLGGVR